MDHRHAAGLQLGGAADIAGGDEARSGIAEYLDAALSGPKMMDVDPKIGARERQLCRLADVYLVPEFGGVFNAREKPEGLTPALDT